MTNLFGSIALDIFAFAAVISSLLVITSKNPAKCSRKTFSGIIINYQTPGTP